jgi:hypothetical protein
MYQVCETSVRKGITPKQTQYTQFIMQPQPLDLVLNIFRKCRSERTEELLSRLSLRKFINTDLYKASHTLHLVQHLKPYKQTKATISSEVTENEMLARRVLIFLLLFAAHTSICVISVVSLLFVIHFDPLLLPVHLI